MTAREDHAPGGSVGRVKVTLRIVGDAVKPEAITAKLGVAPTFAARKGEEIWSRGRSLTQPTGVWSYSVTEAAETGEELDDAIVALLARFPADGKLWRDLAGRYDVGLFCGLFLTHDNQGTDLPNSTLRAIAERYWGLSFDIYRGE